jgi:anthranilate/para-aminobenzoate synthase component II
LTVTARTGDGVIMAVRHRRRPVHGLQFHPESILTEYGQQIISNFVALATESGNKLRS